MQLTVVLLGGLWVVSERNHSVRRETRRWISKQCWQARFNVGPGFWLYVWLTNRIIGQRYSYSLGLNR